MSDIKPVQPPCEGPQFADSPTGGIVSPDNYLDVTYDKFNGEHAEDPVMHGEATPGHSNPQYTGKQYSEDWMGGNKNYGVDVSPPAASRESMDIDAGDAKRGRES